MEAKLNIETQTAKHEKCLKILDMIHRNRRYMLSDIADSSKDLYVSFNGKKHYEERIRLRKKIQNRLICYYAKEVAKLSAEPFEVAMAIREPNQSPIIQS